MGIFAARLFLGLADERVAEGVDVFRPLYWGLAHGRRSSPECQPASQIRRAEGDKL